MAKKRITRRGFVGQSLVASATALSLKNTLGANDRPGIGIIGCGDRTKGSLLKDILEFQKETNVEVVAVCDTWKQMRSEAAQQVKTATGREPKQYTRYQDLLANRDVDAVVIATPEHQHCTQLIEATLAGKDAYVEKPLGMTMEEVNQAYDTVKKHKRIVQNGTQIRSLPQSRAAREFVASGGLGRIIKAGQGRNSYRPYWYQYAERRVEKSDVDWDGFLMMRPPRPFNAKQYAGWYGFREFCLGPHATQGLHFIDTVHYVTNVGCPRYAIAHFAQVLWEDGFTTPDSVEMIFEYPEGFVVRYGQFFGNSGGSYLNFYGTRGTIDGRNWRWDGEWPVIGSDSRAPDRLPDGTKLPPVEGVPHMKNFLQCLHTREEPIAPMEAGYAHAVAGLMADMSNAHRKRMTFDPMTRQIREG